MFANPAGTQQSGTGRLSALEGHGRCGLFLLDQEGQVTFMSVPAGRLLGLSSASGSYPTLPEKLRRFALESVGSHSGDHEDLLEIECPDQNVRTFIAWAIPFSGPQGRSAIAVVLNDVTDLQLLSERLPQIDRLASLGTLSAGMAHELKNSLVSVKTFVSLLLEKNPDAELAGTVRREIGRLENLVTGTLSLAGPDRSRHVVLSLHSIADHAVKLVQAQFSAKDIRLSASLRADPHLVLGDESQLLQVCVNLLLNAMEATPSGGSVAIQTTNLARPGDTGKGRLRLVVTDSGVGIPERDLARIFEPFFTTKRRGTGLGLAIARRIVTEHGGTLSVSSSQGKGSTFEMVLPMAQPSGGQA